MLHASGSALRFPVTRTASALSIAVAVALVVAPASAADEAAQMPAAESTTLTSADDRGDGCFDLPLVLGFDGTVENGVQWRGTGVQEDYVGAFGQAFDLGPGIIRCAAYWLTEIGSYTGQTSDLYVWAGGVDGEPDAVLALVPDVVFSNVPLWPEVGENRVAIDLAVDGPFTVGCWGRWPGESPGGYYVGVDQDGALGPAWTNVALDIGYPPGWQHPSVAWADVTNMAIGVVFDDAPVPVTETSWGQIKALLRR
ncbi:MAG: hypothetical protein R3E97_03095 [Candidatus Eisenbacteria bacterium]